MYRLINGACRRSALTMVALLALGATSPLAADGESKKVRIGVALPAVQMDSAGDSAEAVRTLIAQYLGGPKLDIITLSARIPSQIEAEAKEKACDYVLQAELSQKKARSGGFGLLQGAGIAADVLPYSGAYGSHAGAVAATAARSSVHAASTASDGVRAKSDVALSYRLIQSGTGAITTASSLKRKAKEDGEDVLSPMIEAMATAVVAAAVR